MQKNPVLTLIKQREEYNTLCVLSCWSYAGRRCAKAGVCFVFQALKYSAEHKVVLRWRDTAGACVMRSEADCRQRGDIPPTRQASSARQRYRDCCRKRSVPSFDGQMLYTLVYKIYTIINSDFEIVTFVLNDKHCLSVNLIS